MDRERNGYREDFRVPKKVSIWLNRVLAMTLNDQILLFKYYYDTYKATVELAKSQGDFDRGITNVTAASIKLRKKIAIHQDPVSCENSPPNFANSAFQFTVSARR